MNDSVGNPGSATASAGGEAKPMGEQMPMGTVPVAKLKEVAGVAEQRVDDELKRSAPDWMRVGSRLAYTLPGGSPPPTPPEESKVEHGEVDPLDKAPVVHDSSNKVATAVGELKELADEVTDAVSKRTDEAGETTDPLSDGFVDELFTYVENELQAYAGQLLSVTLGFVLRSRQGRISVKGKGCACDPDKGRWIGNARKCDPVHC